MNFIYPPMDYNGTVRKINDFSKLIVIFRYIVK